MTLEILAASGEIGVQYGPVIGGAVAICGSAWAVVKFLFGRIEKAHQEQIVQMNDALLREQARAERSEARADRYEQELKETVRAWFDQIAPAMGAAAHAIDAVTDELRRHPDDRRTR